MKQIFYDNIVVGSGISALGIIHGLIKKKKKNSFNRSSN